MSKEAITATGIRNWRYLIGMVALLAFVAAGTTFFTNSQTARADATIVCGLTDGNPPTDVVTGASEVTVGQTIYCEATVAIDSDTASWAVGANSTATATLTDATDTDTVLITPTNTVEFLLTGAGTLDIELTYTDANGTHGPDESGQSVDGITVVTTTGVSGETVAAGQEQTITFTLPPGITYCSDTGVAGDARAFTAADQTVDPAANEVSTTPTTELNDAEGTHTVVVTAPASVSLSTKPVGGDDPDDCFATDVAAASAVGELRHMSDEVEGDNGSGDVLAVPDQEVPNNVRGSRHVVCAVVQNTGIYDEDNAGAYVPAEALFIPISAITDINFQPGGGYTSVNDPDPTETDLQIFIGDGDALWEGGNGGLEGATCFSWTSTEAGDQEINVIYTGDDGSPYSINWDTDLDANDNVDDTDGNVNNSAVIKEWNVLEDSSVSSVNGSLSDYYTLKNGVADDGSQVLTIDIPSVFNSATGLFQFQAFSINDVFNGSHVNRAGQVEHHQLVGVNWNIYKVAGCGLVNGSGSNSSTVAVTSGQTRLAADGSVWNNPVANVAPGTGANACTIGDSVTIHFEGSEPGPLGSGAGVTIRQAVVINLIPPATPTKSVLLAWAGQRVMVEHDWRVPAGDTDGGAEDTDPDANGFCPFGGQDGDQDNDYFLVQGIRGSGPGNFLPALGASVLGNDNAFVAVGTEETQEDDDGPNDNCISRFIYESEDQGQVDLEVFAIAQTNFGTAQGFRPSANPSAEGWIELPNQSTKIAYVIYYMKLNQVNVSLVTAVSKPNHNGAGDFAPGNPWDASADVTEADWNVSADLLVRGRVTGWFTNSNPSGRARDDSDPNNVLPADRWVMPTDWALLQGGACGIDCRPEYDYMFAPNNARGIALTTPEGDGSTLVTTTVAGSTTTVIRVASAAGIISGSDIVVGTTAATVSSVSGNAITLTAALGSAPAAGTNVFIAGGTPFEGPFSTLDIPGLAAAGLGGAALSDWDPNNIKDTRLGDGVLDWWDAPMPPAPVTVDINGAGFIREVLKQDVYYLGTANSSTQVYPNAYYITDIPESPYLPAFQAGGGFLWDTWGGDGPGAPSGQGVYRFWNAVIVGANIAGSPGQVIGAALQAELNHARDVYEDDTIARRLTVFSDNHGEFMVQANGDANLDFNGCDTNLYSGTPHCSQGDSVGTSTISATADYPDFRGKHFPVSTNTATVNWTWGGYKEVTVEDGETEQFKYIVLHELDRDGFCRAEGGPAGPISLHPVLGIEVDWIIDSDEGGRFIDAAHLDDDDGLGGRIEITNQSATTTTYSTAETPHGHIEFDPINDSEVECQTWVKLSNSLLGRTNVFLIAHNPEGPVGFDVIIDFTDEIEYTLNFRWSLITWAGADGISPQDALSGTGANEGGTNILDQVTAVYGWQQQSQSWLSFFPDGVGVPGANDLSGLNEGDAYWIAIKGPNSITWTVVTDVN